MLIHSAVITGSVQFNNTDVSGITNVSGFATTASVDALVVKTGSYASTSSVNELQSKTGSYTTTSSFGAYTASNDLTNATQSTRLSTIESVTGSFTSTSSFGAYSSSINTFTSSATTRLNTIESVTGSYASTSSVNNLQSVTGSYASTGSNQFNGNQSISGSITSNGTITAQTLVVQTITSSIEFNTGSTRNGTLLTNTHEFTGSVSITGSAAALLNVNNGVLYVSSSGNVGIGTTTPRISATGGNKTLDIKGGIYFGSTNSESTCINNDDSMIFNIDANNDNASNFFRWATNTTQETGGTELMRLTEAGNIGIGITADNPIGNGGTYRNLLVGNGAGYAAFQGISTATATNSTIAAFSGGTTGASSANKNACSINVELDGTSTTDAVGRLVFYTANSSGIAERMRITSNGDVRIGAQNSTVTTRLAISYDNAYPGDVQPSHLSLCGVTDSRKRLSLGYDTTNNYGWINAGQWGVAWSDLKLNPSSGAVYAGSVRLDTLSDFRVKDNIQPILGSLDKVLQLNGKKFHLKDEPEDKIRYGFIAQDLEGILDEFVINSEMTFKKDDLVVENVKSIDNWASSWAALLVEAIKELKAEIDILKQQ
jgi:hypothetical protein